MSSNAERRAYAIIEDQGRILIVRNQAGRWTLPGGRAYRGESLRDAARREVREETGLKVRLGSRIGARHVRHHNARCDGCVLFRAKSVKGRAKPRSEIDKIKWVPVEEAARRLAAFKTDRVARALDKL